MIKIIKIIKIIISIIDIIVTIITMIKTQVKETPAYLGEGIKPRDEMGVDMAAIPGSVLC